MRTFAKFRIVTSIFGALTLPIVYLNIERWAEKHGYDLIFTKATEGDMPNAFTQFAFSPLTQFAVVAICFLIMGLWLDALFTRLSGGITLIRPNIPTSIKVQFQAGSQNVVQLSNENIESTHFDRAQFDFYGEGDELLEQKVIWLCVLMFNKPTHYRQLIVDAGNANIPEYQIVTQKHNYAVVRFIGDIGNVALTIKTISPNQAL